MTTHITEDFKNLIRKNLTSNGFPNKKVSLPLEKLYEAADKKDLNLNQILEELKAEGVEHEKSLDKIIFSAPIAEQPSNPADMMKQAQEMMSQMSPEQLEEIKSLYENMSDEEKSEIMRKGAEMGLFR